MSWFKRENKALGECQESLKQQLIDMCELKRPLPVGVTEFHAWSDRIIAAAGLTATPESQKFALANIIINLGQTIAFESDEHFINCLRKSAANQVADHIRTEVREAAKLRLAKLEEQNKAEVTAPSEQDGEVLENKTV
jgi:hypothetical protein